jgi:hypothetical protein
MIQPEVAGGVGWAWRVLLVTLWVSTIFNVHSRVEQGGRSVDFGYDASQQRAWRRTDTGDLTTYVGDWYEHRRAGGQSQHLFSIKAEGRTVATVAVQEGAPEEQVPRQPPSAFSPAMSTTRTSASSTCPSAGGRALPPSHRTAGTTRETNRTRL